MVVYYLILENINIWDKKGKVYFFYKSNEYVSKTWLNHLKTQISYVSRWC